MPELNGCRYWRLRSTKPLSTQDHISIDNGRRKYGGGGEFEAWWHMACITGKIHHSHRQHVSTGEEEAASVCVGFGDWANFQHIKSADY